MAAFKGTNGYDYLVGTGGDDRLSPLLGYDTVIGGAGRDTLVLDYGGAQSRYSFYSPSYVFSDGQSLSGFISASDGSSSVSFREVEHVVGTLDSGNNVLFVNTAGGAAPTFDLNGGAGEDYLGLNVEWLGTGFEFGVDANGKVKSTLGTFSGFEAYEIALGVGSHRVATGAGNDRILNYGGTARIHTGAGNDQILSYHSVDRLDGGAGADRWDGDYRYTTAGVTFSYDGSSGLLSNGTTLKNIESFGLVTGSADDNFRITAPSEMYLSAGAGFDTLIADFSTAISAPDQVWIGSDWNGALFGTLPHTGSFSEFENVSYAAGSGNTFVSLNLQGLTRGAELSVDGGKGYDMAYVLWQSGEPLVFAVGADGTLTSNVGIRMSGFESFAFELGNGDDVVSGSADFDSIYARGGNDRLDGRGGADFLNGGWGSDTFVFSSVSDLISSDGIDHVFDFSSAQGDLIDVQGLAEGTFTFLGEGSFSSTGNGPELRYDEDAGLHFVEGDVDGDGLADFQFLVTTSSLNPSDFLL